MNFEEYKKLIIQILQSFDDSDYLFAKQIYTIVKRHLDKKGRH